MLVNGSQTVIFWGKIAPESGSGRRAIGPPMGVRNVPDPAFPFSIPGPACQVLPARWPGPFAGLGVSCGGLDHHLWKFLSLSR